jgi:indole-3-glycerol phosphate synthase
MILDEIVADKRIEIAKRKTRVSLAEFRSRAESVDATRDFAGSLRGENVALIAEIKSASPSRGEIRADVNPARIAQIYASNGASAISVLTDRKYFRGDLNSLKGARVGSDLPLLRKDFIVDEYQLYESRALQADAVLLIARVLDDSQLRDYLTLAESLEMSALVEVHDERELERAIYSGAAMVGINNRNLADFSVHLGTTERLAPLVPRDATVVSESGIFSREDVERMARARADAVLVGEALMRAQDIGAKVRDLSQVANPRAYFKTET